MDLLSHFEYMTKNMINDFVTSGWVHFVTERVVLVGGYEYNIKR